MLECKRISQIYGLSETEARSAFKKSKYISIVTSKCTCNLLFLFIFFKSKLLNLRGVCWCRIGCGLVDLPHQPTQTLT